MGKADGDDPERGTDGTPAPGRKEFTHLSSQLADLDARLKAAQARETEQAAGSGGGSLPAERGLLGQAWRLSAELVSGLIAGGGLGWLLDRWLDTKPWLMLVFFLLGAVAGLNLAIKSAQRMMRAAPAETDEAGKAASGKSSDAN